VLLARDGREPNVLRQPDLGVAEENAYRRRLLDEHRSYERREGLFLDFPREIEWFRAELDREELLDILYINWDWWLRMSGGPRLPLDAAARIRRDEAPEATVETNEPIAARLLSADPPPPLIVVAPTDHSKLVLLEGHVRLTAYALFPEYLPGELEVYLGTSDEINRWSEF
jgi:hypothetical protein